MIRPNPYFVEYPSAETALSPREKKIVSFLKQAVRETADLYALQVDKLSPGGNFYPKNITKTEIARLAKENPEILSHFTVVERSHDEGKLIAIPYHIRYEAYLNKIDAILRRAYQASNDEEISSLLRVQRAALHNDTYEQAIMAWVLTDPRRIGFSLGPMEPYEDKFFYRKCGYQAWVGTINTGLTDRCEEIKRAIVRIRRHAAFPSERIEFLRKTRISVINTFCAGGLLVDYRFSAITLPNNISHIEKFGTKTALYLPRIQQTFQERQQRNFQAIFESRFKDGFATALLERAYFYLVLLHEVARFTTRYRHARERLEELYPIFNEMVVEVFAVRLASTLLLKDIFTDKEFESILVLFICRLLDGFLGTTRHSVLEAYKRNEIDAYVSGNVVMLNFLLNSGSIRNRGGISWPNFVRVFLEIEHLSEPIERILGEGSYADAKRFLQRHGSLVGIKKLHPRQEDDTISPKGEA